MIYLAAANEPDAGWGKLVGLLAGVGLFWLGITIHQRYLAVKDEPLSPTNEGVALEGVKPQINTVADPAVTPFEKGSTVGATDLDGFVRTRVGTARPSQIITDAQRRFRVSQSTVKRAIRRARGGQS